MKSALLLGSVAAAALAAPAFAAPDRYEQHYACTGSSAQCIQDQMTADVGNRATEKTGTPASGIDGTGPGGVTRAALGGDDDDEVGDEIGDAAEEAGDEISEAADDAGDEVGDAADEIGDTFD
jgi:hypothetical protein